MELDSELYAQYKKDSKAVRAEANQIWQEGVRRLKAELGRKIIAARDDGASLASINRQLNIPGPNAIYDMIRAAEEEEAN